MEYKFALQDDFEDFASGRVLYQKPGMTNFPVRLMNEIFLRCVTYAKKKDEITLYDPCCGGGYLVTVLGMLQRDKIAQIYGSDVSIEALNVAKNNTALLTLEGLEQRKTQLQSYYENFQKDSHLAAVKSCQRIKERLSLVLSNPYVEFFQADATDLKEIKQMNELPDIIIADVPYGKLVDWSEQKDDMIDRLFDAMMTIAKSGTVIAICSDKHQKISVKTGVRKEKQLIGKRKFEIFVKG